MGVVDRVLVPSSARGWGACASSIAATGGRGSIWLWRGLDAAHGLACQTVAPQYVPGEMGSIDANGGTDMAFDFKKEYKELYAPKKGPSIVEVPRMTYVAVRAMHARRKLRR